MSQCVPAAALLETALGVAAQLARGPQHALRWTKRSLNHWVRSAIPIFEASLAHEMLNFFDRDIAEGVRALQEKREPVFPSAADDE